VVGINGIGHFLGKGGDLSETLARHIDYVANLAGIDHVAIGLDYVFDTDELIEYLRSNPALFGRMRAARRRASSRSHRRTYATSSPHSQS